MFTPQQLAIIADLVLAGGKSPLTGAGGMQQALLALGWLQQAIAQAAADAPPEVPAASR